MNTDRLDHETGLLLPDWPAPDNVLALCTTRVSFQKPEKSTQQSRQSQQRSGYGAFNLALHVGDDADSVLSNRKRLAHYLTLPETRIAWLEQVHGTEIVCAETACRAPASKPLQADACITEARDIACTVMTADCLPALFCNLPESQEPQMVAAAHAGWRGLAAGILTKTLARFPQSENVIAWLGPAISQQHFEVGLEVFNAFISKDPGNSQAFTPITKQDSDTPKWHACLYTLARIELEKAGIKQVYGGGLCSFEQQQAYYSYRRDGAVSGRMASLIMLKS